MILFLCTLLHFSVDGVCAAVMADYAVHEPDFSQIIFYFGMYNLIAFGGQWLFGLMLDKYNKLILPSLVLVPVLLGVGMFREAGVFWQALALGVDNCMFHVAAGIVILTRSDTFREPGIFVSSGAVGLGLGLGGLVGAIWFWAVCAAGTVLVVRLLFGNVPDYARSSREGSESSLVSLLTGAAVLLGCVVLRGFGGSSRIPEYAMLMPCVFMVGKAAGGVVCDVIGYRKTILLIFLLCFVSLQLSGYPSVLLLTFAFNMTMPLTLRLLHWYFPEYPGLTFGLAAGCLLPGAFLKGMKIFPDVMAVMQFIGLFAAGYILWRCGKFRSVLWLSRS